jgi:hypothetical protein
VSFWDGLSLIGARAAPRFELRLGGESTFMERSLLGRLARRDRHAEALHSGAESLSFGDLCQAAERVGNSMKVAGFEPGTAVGVLLEDPLERVVAAIGILGSGGAYFTLSRDEAVPQLVVDDRVALVLTEAGFTPVLAPLGVPGVIRTPIRSDASAYHAGPDAATGEGTARVAAPARRRWHTLDHMALADILTELETKVNVGPRDRLLALSASPAHDGDLGVILPLALGARVQWFGPPQNVERELLGAAWRDSRATLLEMPTPALERWVQEQPDEVEGLRVFCAGAYPSPAAVARARKMGAELWSIDFRRRAGPWVRRLDAEQMNDQSEDGMEGTDLMHEAHHRAADGAMSQQLRRGGVMP